MNCRLLRLANEVLDRLTEEWRGQWRAVMYREAARLPCRRLDLLGPQLRRQRVRDTGRQRQQRRHRHRRLGLLRC
jgi:hypothetical protein